MHPYLPNTEQEIKAMLDNIGVKSTDELFEDIPASLKLSRKLNLSDSLSEFEIRKHFKELASKNTSIEDKVCFLGAGIYDHYIPSVIPQLISRAEFFTSYTPYQPEISQGSLQAAFEYQSMICELTGMDVSNISLYDGATAAAEASVLACVSTRRKKVLVSNTVSPETRAVLKTYFQYRNMDIVEVSSIEGQTDIDDLKSKLDKDTAGVLLQYPNFFGIIEDISKYEPIIHENKSLMMLYTDPIALGLLKSPGELGADMALGDGQALGLPLNFGGPTLGFINVKDKLLRKMPGRIVGQSVDSNGNRAFVLTLQAREQHIRRQDATSNICSDQTLNAIRAGMYLAVVGKEGIKEVANACLNKANYAYKELQKLDNVQALFEGPIFKEFAIKTKASSEKVLQALLEAGILGGYSLSSTDYGLENAILIAVTEKRTKEEIDKLVSVIGGVR